MLRFYINSNSNPNDKNLNQKAMTKKHLQFCIYYMQVGDPLVAYKMTYPRAAVKSLPASVSRLMARPDVAEWVNGTE